MAKFSTNIRIIYLYMVCFTTLMMVLFGGARLASDVVDVFLEPTYRAPQPLEIERRLKQMADEDIQLTKEELKQQIEIEHKQEQERQKYYNVKQVVEDFSLILIGFPVYWYHWRKIRDEKKTQKEE
ncbi:MAG: hypothetical protein H0Z39_04180 [Peptococcaceae bacterium]|nr:hypothetical protein [Peptococcaceae bacterium]